MSKLVYNIKTDQIIINPEGGGNRTVNFQSEQFYDKNYMYRIQNVSTVNPIILLHVLSLDYGKKVDAISFAKRINPKFDVSNVKTLLFDCW